MHQPSKTARREVDTVILSDIHLGTFGCHAKELSSYLSSIKPHKLILNGDIVDVWQFNKKYFPNAHMKVLHQIIKFISNGTEVVYITGNHDEMLRKFSGFKLGNFSIDNKLILNMDGKKAWIFHGDVFDVTMQHSRWLTKMGAVGYDLLILLNRAINFISEKAGKGKISLSKTIKNSVKSAVKYINNFELTCVGIAISNKYDYVVCGHIHHPEIKTVTTDKGSVVYLNSGDWVENLSALEYNEGEWSLYKYLEDETLTEDNHLETMPSNKDLFQYLVREFELLKSA